MRLNELASWSWLVALACGCWAAPSAVVRTGPGDPGQAIPGLTACTPETTGPLDIDPTRPLAVFIHGCNYSKGDFTTLAAVFEAHHQQTICFNYNDRDQLVKSSQELKDALGALERRMTPQQITVLGYSQGGLVLRHALSTLPSPTDSKGTGFEYRAVTIATPYGGIRASSHCGLPWLHVLSLGMTVGICEAIAGDKWTEIFPGSAFMAHPKSLTPRVSQFVKVVTDESNSCRRKRPDGSCAEDDVMFTVDEQQNDRVDADPRVASVNLTAGHVAIVGRPGMPPNALMTALQQAGILAQTPVDQRDAMATLLRRLY